MTWEKTLVRNFLFAVLIMAAGFYCTGCCTMSVIQNLGTTRTHFSEYRYEMSPGCDEIILTGKRTKEYNYLPFYGGLHLVPAWTSVKDYEKRIPLIPLPEDLVRCNMVVETAPDAPRAKVMPLYPLPPDEYLDNDRRKFSNDMRFLSPDEVTDLSVVQFEFEAFVDELPVGEGETIHLRVHPNDLPYLSQSFRLIVWHRGDEGLPEEKRSGWDRYRMFPYAMNGNRYELLCSNSLMPFDEEWLRETKQDYWRSLAMKEIIGYGGDESSGSPSFGVICWKVLWFPSAVVADVILIPISFPVVLLLVAFGS